MNVIQKIRKLAEIARDPSATPEARAEAARKAAELSARNNAFVFEVRPGGRGGVRREA